MVIVHRGKACSALLFGLLLLPFASWSQSTEAEYFLETIKESGQRYNFKFWVDGLKAVSRVEFNDEHINRYLPFFNSLNLSRSLSMENNEIRAWTDISAVDLGILAHESWHSYFENYLKRDSRFFRLKDFFFYRAENLFWTLPKDKARVALEEAYAVFIGNTVMSLRWIDFFVERAREQSMECERMDAMIDRMWQSHWNTEINGYYYRDRIDEWWTDRAQELWSWITGSKKDRPSEGVYYTEESLTALDKKWIYQNLFEGRVVKDSREMFGECAAALQAE